MPFLSMVVLAVVPELILINGTIHTGDPSRPRVAAVAIANGRFVHVGARLDALALKGPGSRVIDLAGKTVVPGLVDAHGHVAGLGFSLSRVALTGTTSAADVASRVRARVATARPGQWITGRGWDQNDWADRAFPDHSLLTAAAPDHPVMLDRVDGHAIWVNAAAMKLAGVSAATPDLAGGRILRDASGNPTGVFVDEAEGLIAAKIPRPGREEIKDALRLGIERCLAAGLTGVHDAGVSAIEIELYQELLADGGLPFRIYAMLADSAETLDRFLPNGPKTGLAGGRLSVRAVKLYMDGALGSRGAALLEPYTDEPGNFGLPQMSQEELNLKMKRVMAAGFQICTHAIGDRGNRMALDGLALASGPGDARHRIEHAQVLSPSDIPRFARQGVIASMQPTHATSDRPWAADRLGAERVKGAYAWRSLLASGARIACGSDFPVETEAPLAGFFAAITRQDVAGFPEGGWDPEQKLTREEALACFTREPAWASFQENELGMIAAGRLADLTVLSRDILSIPASEIPQVEVDMTIVGGRVGWERK